MNNTASGFFAGKVPDFSHLLVKETLSGFYKTFNWCQNYFRKGNDRQ